MFDFFFLRSQYYFYRSYLLDHDYTSLRPYHEMPPQLPARRLQLPAALPRIRSVIFFFALCTEVFMKLFYEKFIEF